MTTSQVDLLKRRMKSLLEFMEEGTPDYICAGIAAGVVQQMTLVWPDLWLSLGKEMQRGLRNAAGLCAECGETQIPAILTHDVTCRECERKFAESLESDGIDVHAPNPPDVEEVLVDLTIEECRKVNNVDEDFLDHLQRMLEARK